MDRMPKKNLVVLCHTWQLGCTPPNYINCNARWLWRRSSYRPNAQWTATKHWA